MFWFFTNAWYLYICDNTYYTIMAGNAESIYEHVAV